MFLASTPPKIASQAAVKDYFDSESESSCKKNVENSIFDQTQQSQSKQGDNSLKQIDRENYHQSQMEIEKLRGVQAISQQQIPEQLKQIDGFQFKGYFSSEKKELSPSDKGFSDEEDLQYFQKNSHIFAQSILAEKKSDFNNKIDHSVIKGNDLNQQSYLIQGQEEAIDIDNNNQLSVKNNSLYQINKSFLSILGQPDKAIFRVSSSQPVQVTNNYNNIFAQSNQIIIDSNQNSFNSQNSYLVNKQNNLNKDNTIQNNQKGVIENQKPIQMIKTQLLPNSIENDKILFDAQYQFKEMNQQNNYENDILQQEFEIEINQSDDEMGDQEEMQKRDVNIILQSSNIQKSDNSFNKSQNLIQKISTEQDIIFDQNSNQSRIGGLTLKDTQISSQLKCFFDGYRESSTESEGSKGLITRQVENIINQNSNNSINFSKVNMNGGGQPDPFRNEDFFQKKQKNNGQQNQIQFGFAKPSNSTVNEQKNNKIDRDQNKRDELFQDLKQSIGFSISNKAKLNTNFQKFSNLFEGFDDEEEVEEENNEDEEYIQEFTKSNNQSLQDKKQSTNSFTLLSKKENSNNDQDSKFIFSKPVVTSLQKRNEKAKIEQKPEENKEQNKNSNLLNELKQMNGFKVSAKAQKDEKFSKFLGFFENMSDEEAEQEEDQENKGKKKSELEGNMNQGLSISDNNSNETDFGFGFAKPKLNGTSKNGEVGFGFAKPKSNGDTGFGFSKPKLNGAQEQNKEEEGIGFSFSKGTSNGFQKIGKNSESIQPKPKNLQKFESMFEDLSDNQDSQQDQQKENKQYEDFFNKQSDSNDGFVGFKIAKNDRKLEVDEKVMNKLMKVFDADKDKPQKILYKQPNKIEEEEEEEDSKKYDDFFSKKSDTPFMGFKIVKGNKELKIDPKQLEQLEKAFSVGEDDGQSKSKQQQNKGKKRKTDLEDEEEEGGFSGFSGFSNAVGSKKLKVDEAKLKKFQAMMDKDDDEEDDFEIPIRNENSNTKMSGFNQSKQSTFSSKPSSISKDIKKTPTMKIDNKKSIDSKSRFQNSETSFKSSIQKSSKSRIDEEEDDEDDDFSRMLKLVKKPEPKREHPKPFKLVKVVDSSKSTPVTKITPTIKSVKVGSKLNQKFKGQMSEENGSFLFTSADKSGQKSGKTSLSKPFSKPQSLERTFESGNNELNKKLKDLFNKNSNRYSFINEEEEEGQGNKRQLFSSSKKSSKSRDMGSAIKQIPVVMNEYLGNPIIQMKYSFDSQLTNVKIVKYEELKVKINKMDIEGDAQQSYTEQCSKDINQCTYFSIVCNCYSQMIGQFLLDFHENSYNKKMECFCSLPIPSTESLDEEEREKNKNQVDKTLENCKNKLRKGYLNYLNFYAKLQQKEKILEERWVRTHFRQVVWKLANYESNLVDCPINKRLTIENIYNELEFRLYTEMYICKRSILKQIEEQDAVKSLNMVLQVNNIIHNKSQGAYLIELSDGWYSFYVVVFSQNLINNDMYYQSNKILILDLILKKKIYIGQKFYVNSIGQPPIGGLEKFISPNQNLQYQKIYEIYYNNIRRAPPTAKLGICDNSFQKYFPRSLKSIRPYGGADIQTIDVFIIKKYPLCYESGHVKRAFCNPKQMEDEGMDGSKTLGFTVLVVDALSYYDPQFQHDQQPWVEINIHSVTQDLYDSLREGTRIRLYNVKINNKGKQTSKFDFKQQRIIKNILYFDTTKKTKIEEMSTFIKSKEDQQKMKNFGLELIENYKFLLEDVQESINNLQYDKEILLSQLQANKVEMDIIMYIVKIENGSYFGINQNYSAICISPTQEIQSSTNTLFKKQNNNDEYSKEDAHLYEKLSKNREIKVVSIDEKSNKLPSSLQQNTDEGKIGIFLNVQLNNIKDTTLSTSNLDKYHFNFTFNTHKKTYAYEGLNIQSLPYSDKYKQWIIELNEFIRISSDKFYEVSNYLRNL